MKIDHESRENPSTDEHRPSSGKFWKYLKPANQQTFQEVITD